MNREQTYIANQLKLLRKSIVPWSIMRGDCPEVRQELARTLRDMLMAEAASIAAEFDLASEKVEVADN